jgi:hypothetical protein
MLNPRNIVPRVDGEGSIGTASKKWGTVYANNFIGSGNVGLKTITSLSDADHTLTASQVIGGIVYITPTTTRIITFPVISSLITLIGLEIGSWALFTIASLHGSSYVRLAALTGLTYRIYGVSTYYQLSAQDTKTLCFVVTSPTTLDAFILG